MAQKMFSILLEIYT